MKITYLKNGCKLFIFLLILFTESAYGQVTYRDTVISWKHFDYTLDENNGMGPYSTTEIVEDLYNGVVIENEYVRLVVIPEFGARVLSFFYKPSGHEQFYVNPVGTPYGMNEGNFYYDWLMVYGGVFPTFPEPEHGKTWFLEWQWELTEVSADKISLRMELQDTINFPFHPGKFNNGITEVRCTSTVTLRKGKTCFQFQHDIENTKQTTVPFEYWTCLTLAPGSDPENTFTPANSEIVAPIDYIYLKDDWWSWMGNAEKPAYNQGNHVFEYNNLAIYDNWEDMGIGYAYPAMEAGYYGVINHENSEGIFRVADNSIITSGMKFWTWGADQGLNANPFDFYDVARPYIELWSGLSSQFFEDAYLQPDETISIKETYLPTVGLESATFVNESGAVHQDHTAEGGEKLTASIFMTSPGKDHEVIFSLEGMNSITLPEGAFTSDAGEPAMFSFLTDDYSIEDGDYTFIARVFDNSGLKTLEASIPVRIPYQSQGITVWGEQTPKLLRVLTNRYKIEFVEKKKRTLSVFALNGQLINRKNITGREAFIYVEKSGVYVLLVSEGNRQYSLKLLF